MKKILPIIICLILSPNFVSAAVNLPWETTYDCNNWNSYNDPLSCDGLSKGGSWTCDQGGTFWEQISSDANYPLGRGGSGQRHWLADSLNDCSGGTNIVLNSSQPEFWIRWYMRFEEGFRWSLYEGFKILYFIDDSSGANSYILIAYDGTNDKLSLYAQLGDHNHYECSQCGWKSIYPTGVSNGSWVMFEMHLKSETSGQNNGVLQMWKNGQIVINVSSVNYGLADSGRKFRTIVVGENQKYPNNGRCMYVDYDDIKIVGAGDPSLKDDGSGNLFIGPISATPADTTPPAPPSGLSVS